LTCIATSKGRGGDKYKDDSYFNVLEMHCTASGVQPDREHFKGLGHEHSGAPPAAYPIVL
jgi:hypothetical protein